jgi:uncharacterized delta-60 repeat protein
MVVGLTAGLAMGLVLMAPIPHTLAAPGDLDTTFGADGTVTGPDLASAHAIAIQADGKIVAAGVGEKGFVLARYDPDGTLDTTFSGNGKVITPFLSGGTIYDVAIGSDGKVVTAGGAAGERGNAKFAIARYNPDGTPDTTFGGDGKVTTDLSKPTNHDAGFDAAYAIAPQADGKIVAAGVAAGGRFGLARFNPDGTLDTSFSGDGMSTTNSTPGGRGDRGRHPDRRQDRRSRKRERVRFRAGPVPRLMSDGIHQAGAWDRRRVDRAT